MHEGHVITSHVRAIFNTSFYESHSHSIVVTFFGNLGIQLHSYLNFIKCAGYYNVLSIGRTDILPNCQTIVIYDFLDISTTVKANILKF